MPCWRWLYWCWLYTWTKAREKSTWRTLVLNFCWQLICTLLTVVILGHLLSVVVCRSQPDPWYQVSADLNQSHCANTQSSAGGDPPVAFLLLLLFLILTASSHGLARSDSTIWLTAKISCVSEQFIWSPCIRIIGGYQHWIHKTRIQGCVGGWYIHGRYLRSTS